MINFDLARDTAICLTNKRDNHNYHHSCFIMPESKDFDDFDFCTNRLRWRPMSASRLLEHLMENDLS